ncbi:hypothetical protein HYZ70_00535 [Candidatus Curtissbacteria bacterium]|nr:hypothetical protein [Candidatus Curtissbacteria bacterium]
MKKVVFTKHAEKKLHGVESLKLGITKKHILDVLRHPIVVDKDMEPKQSVGRFNEELSLSVIWKMKRSG